MSRTLIRASLVTIVYLIMVASLSAQVQVMVGDRTNGVVTVLDQGLSPIGTVTLPSSPTAADPLGIAVNPTNTLGAVSNFNANRIDFLDLTVSPPVVTGASVTFTSPALFPEDMVFSPDGACLVASDGRPGFVASVDVVNRVVVTSLTTVQSQAVEFIPNNTNHLVLTADQVGNKIHVLTLGVGCTLTDTGTTVATPGIGPRNITALPSGQVALVSHQDGTVGILSISGTTVSFTGSFSLGGANPRIQGIVVVPSLSRAYAYQCATGNVEILNIDAAQNVTDSGVGVAAGIALCFLGAEQLATDGKSLFVSTSAGVTAINLTNNNVLGTVSTSTNPTGIAVSGFNSSPPEPIVAGQPTTFVFPTSNEVVLYPNDVVIPPGTTMVATATTYTTAGFQNTRTVGSTFFSQNPNTKCIVYPDSPTSATGSCIVFEDKCFEAGNPTTCPTSPQPNIIVSTTINNLPTTPASLEPLPTNPGFLTADDNQNDWMNIFLDMYVYQSAPAAAPLAAVTPSAPAPGDPVVIRGHTTGFNSDFVAVDIGPDPSVGAGTFQGFQPPLAPKNARVFTRGTTIPVKFQVVSATNAGQFITNATAELTAVLQANPPVQEIVGAANRKGTDGQFVYNPKSGRYEYYLSTTGYPAGNYTLTVFSNSFPAQVVTFTLQ